jgi:S1-C subfamily serine protease
MDQTTPVPPSNAAAPLQPEPFQPDAVQPNYTVTATHPAPRRSRRRTAFFIGGATALALCIGGGGVALGAGLSSFGNTSAIAASGTDTVTPGSYVPTSPFSGGPSTGSGAPSTGSGTGTQGSTTTQSSATAATDDQKVGVVTIVSNLYYSDSAEAAGTGIVLTANGKILTNNHVISGSTSIAVTIESTGETYQAEVIGTDSTNDIAVLQLVDSDGDAVTGLDTATLDQDALAVSDTVTSVGNAEGTGDLVSATGTVTALDQDITVGSETSSSVTESLTGLIEIDADVVSGDSGGPLIDAEGEVTGIVTAASSGTADITGYAIPIETALTIAQQIVTGDATSGTVTIGLPAFLGVELAQTQAGTGVVVGGVIEGTGAATSGIVAGDTITAFDGTAVATSDELSAAVAAHSIGDSVTVTYTTAAGASNTVTVVLTAGPAD